MKNIFKKNTKKEEPKKDVYSFEIKRKLNKVDKEIISDRVEITYLMNGYQSDWLSFHTSDLETLIELLQAKNLEIRHE